MGIELKALGDCLKIDNRTLRYIVEAGIVSGIDKVNQGRGSRRVLTKKQAVQVAVAAALHDQGLRGPAVKSLVKQAGKQAHQGDVCLTLEATTGKLLPLRVQLNLDTLTKELEKLSN